MIEATPMGYRLENAADLGELRVEAGPVLIFPLDVTVVQIQHATDALSAAIAPPGGYTPPITGQDAFEKHA